MLYRSQHSVIPTGGWCVCGCGRCPAMHGRRNWLGWGWWCRCQGEPGASLADPMPVSCSAEPSRAHLGHCTLLTGSMSCSPSPAPEPSPRGLAAHPEFPILTAWPPCLRIPRSVSQVVQTRHRLVALLSGAAAAAAPVLLHMSHPGTARGAACARKRGTLMQFVAI